MTVGTVAYAAPEQLMGEQMDGRADQYALAATAYHLLTGVQLFPHSNPAVVISRHLNSPSPALANTRPELVGLDPAIALALSKNPDDRFHCCRDFARALSEHASGDSRSPASVTTKPRTIPPSSMPSGLLDARIAEPPQRRTPSTPRWLVAAAVLTVILTAGVLLLTTRPWEIRESTTTTTTSNVVPSEPAIATAQRPPTTTLTSSTPVATATTARPEPVPTFQTALPLCYDSIPIAEKPSSGGLLCKGHWFENMTWNSWGPDAADGAGIEALKGCTPSCATGELSRYPVEVHFLVSAARET